MKQSLSRATNRKGRFSSVPVLHVLEADSRHFRDSDTQVLKPETKALYDYIHENNQVSQRELRKEFPMSDAKLSLIVTDLEERGLIKKIKRGRGNVLIDQSE